MRDERRHLLPWDVIGFCVGGVEYDWVVRDGPRLQRGKGYQAVTLHRKLPFPSTLRNADYDRGHRWRPSRRQSG